jgi:hypothetical protein
VVSPTTSVAASEKLIVFAEVSTVAKVISSDPSKNLISSELDPEFVVSSHKVPVVAEDGRDVPECIEFNAPKILFNSVLKAENP